MIQPALKISSLLNSRCRNTFLFSFLFVFCISCVRAEPVKKNTVDPDPGAAFIQAINTTNDSIRLALMQAAFSASMLEGGMEKLKDFFERMHLQFAPLDYHHAEILKYEKPGGASYVMHVYARKKGEIMYRDFQMYVEAPPVQKITKIVFIAEVAEPISLPNGSIHQQETLHWLDNYVEKLRETNQLSGSILIAEGHKILYERYFGFADPDHHRNIDRGTLFNMASGGKMFTALVIAKLVEKNKLSYNDNLNKYLKGFTEKELSDKITIHHLLSHTSGIREYWTSETDEAVRSAKSTEDHLKLVYRAGLERAAGVEYHYCNSNYILLGAVIEKLYGQSLYSVVQSEIFDKAAMKSSGYFEYGFKNMAVPMARDSAEGKWKEARHGIKGSSAGGAYSNSHDILNFAIALNSGQLVTMQSLSELISNKTVGLADAEDYGYGFILQNPGQERSYGHGGTADGVNFEFRYFSRQNITLIVFSNQNNGAYDDLRRNAIKLISGQR